MQIKFNSVSLATQCEYYHYEMVQKINTKLCYLFLAHLLQNIIFCEKSSWNES